MPAPRSSASLPPSASDPHRPPSEEGGPFFEVRMKLTAKAEAEARALGVVVDLVDVKSRLERQAPPWVEGHRTVRLGRPSRARVVLDGGDDVVAVLPSSPHAEAGAPDVRGGDPDRKRARDQERWERRQRAHTVVSPVEAVVSAVEGSMRAAVAVARDAVTAFEQGAASVHDEPPATATQYRALLGRPRLDPEAPAEATVVRLGRDRQARAAARAAADGVSLAELVRRAVDAYLEAP